jgi:Transposase DDE domain
MLPTEELFVYCYVLLDDAIKEKIVDIPARPGPHPACTDSEVLTIALVRHILGRRSESGFLREVIRDWSGLFPVLPHQSEFNRRVRWLWGAFEQLRVYLADQIPTDEWQQVDTSALPVKHPSRVRGPDGWSGPCDLVARFGYDSAHAEWFYGFRIAIRTDLGSRVVRAWEITRAAINERDAATDLLEDDPHPPVGLLCDKGFNGTTFADQQAQRGITVLIPPTKKHRKTMLRWLQQCRLPAGWDHRVATT